MGRQAGIVLYVLALVAVVVGVDVLFFKHQFLGAPDGQRRDCPSVRGVLLRFLNEHERSFALRGGRLTSRGWRDRASSYPCA